MTIEIKKVSLRENTESEIGEFLRNEGFGNCSKTPKGILELINMVSDYHEEGKPFFPELLITNDRDFFKTIPNSEIVIREDIPLEIKEFKNIIKLCAPLAINSWIIFIEIKNNKLKYGIVSAEVSETSLSIFQQTVGELSVDVENITIAYLRNIGHKTVELIGLKTRLIISLSLDHIDNFLSNQILQLSKSISKKCNSVHINQIINYFDKIINDACKNGHGNLIGIIDDSEETITRVKADIADGIYFSPPIDIAGLVTTTEELKKDNSVALKSYRSVFISMVNHDGVTIITNKGKVIGYHIFIGNDTTEKNVIGGARTRAFESMKDTQLFECCFYKSQDGNIKLWKKNE